MRFDCPVPGCENIGKKGIKRYDNLVAHMRNKHGVSQTGGSCGSKLVALRCPGMILVGRSLFGILFRPRFVLFYEVKLRTHHALMSFELKLL